MNQKPLFDKHEHSYTEQVNEALNFIGKDVDFFTQLKAKRLLELSQRLKGDLNGLYALDLGCGIGLTDSYLSGRFAGLHGADVSNRSLDRAREANPSVRYSGYDGHVLPYTGEMFDIVFAICAMHHVLPDSRANFLAEIRRVLKPDGLGVIFEHNPLNPLTRIAVARCEFDRDVVLVWPRNLSNLFIANGFLPIEKKYIAFFPWSHPLVERLEHSLGWLPLGGQYYMVARKK